MVDKDDCGPVGLNTYECGGVVYVGLWALRRWDFEQWLKPLVGDRINGQLGNRGIEE